jgi:membrane-associated protease RseP (regulator of RpoE activity)
MKRRTSIGFWLAIVTTGALLVPTAYGQVRPKNRAPAPVPAQPAAPAVGETAGQTRREGRQDARESRAEAKQAGETRPEARETARETRQETRQNIQATTPANLGVTFNNAAANGLVVSNLATNSVLATAGLRSGDQIVSLNGQPVSTQAQFYQYLTGPNLGTQAIPLIVMRNGQRQTLNLQPTAFATQSNVNVDPLAQYGLVVDATNPNQIVVVRVLPGSPAFIAGIRQGDIITMANGQAIASLNGFTQLLNQATGPIGLQVNRAGQTQNLQLAAASSNDSSVRTALRPNFDGGAGANAQGAAGATAPGINATVPGVNATAPAPNIGTQPQSQGQGTSTAPQPPSTQPAPAAPTSSGAPQAGATGSASGSANISGSANTGGSTNVGAAGTASANTGAGAATNPPAGNNNPR